MSRLQGSRLRVGVDALLQDLERLIPGRHLRLQHLILHRVRAEVQTAELAHNFPSTAGGFFADMTIALFREYPWYLNQYEVALTGTEHTSAREAETCDYFGCRRPELGPGFHVKLLLVPLLLVLPLLPRMPKQKPRNLLWLSKAPVLTSAQMSTILLPAVSILYRRGVKIQKRPPLSPSCYHRAGPRKISGAMNAA